MSELMAGVPLWIALVPMLGAVPVYFLAERRLKAGAGLAVGLSVVPVVLAALVLPTAIQQPTGLSFTALGRGLSVGLDGFSGGLVLLAAAAWCLAMVYSLDYMSHGQRRPRYWAFMLFTMGATLGVFTAGDLFTLFIFFELMTFASYVLVVHEENSESMAAGRTFVYMGVVGGLALLGGIMLTGYVAGVDLGRSVAGELLASGYFPAVSVLMLIGFGMKAGMVPLHIWLPQAHPVAPAPASAVLSGVLIKAGAYGLVRMFIVVLGPETGTLAPAVVNGLVLLSIGVTTMIAGGVMAIFQTNAKRILAYSSVSQIGYILTGLGAAVVVGEKGAMGFAGAYYHMINHVVFKAAAFMAIGYVYMVTHELDIRKLGGLVRTMPVAAIAFVASFGAITGLPGFSGFASKTAIHHAIVEAYEYSGIAFVDLAEKLFVVGSALTAVYFLRLAGIFFGPVAKPVVIRSRLVAADVALLVLTGLILAVGLVPGAVLSAVVLPATEAFPYSDYALGHVRHLEFFLLADIRDVFVPLAMGIALFLVLARTGLIRRRLPSWLSVELVYGGVVHLGTVAILALGRGVDRGIDGAYVGLAGWAGKAAMQLDEEPGVDGAPAARWWAPWNLNFCTLILALALAVVVGIVVWSGYLSG